MSPYEAKIEARRMRMEAKAARLAGEAQARHDKAESMASIIPLGQPILVGHHSEKGDRSYRAKIRSNFEKAHELQKAAAEASARAASIGTGGISNDDPDAVTKLRSELAKREAYHAGIRMRAHESWELSNSSANIRRIKVRIEALEHNRATRQTKETEGPGGIRIVENAEANRLQIFFPSKPNDATRVELKSSGFRWAPSEGAWQRQLSNSARFAAASLRCVR